MDKIKLLIDLLVMVITVDIINGDTLCDCSSMMDGQEFIKAELLQIKFDNFKIKSRLRRLEASKLHSTRPNDGIVNKESDRQSAHDDEKEETHDDERIYSMEAKFAGIEYLLKNGDINGTDVQKGTIQSQLLDEIENKLASVLQQVNDTIAKNDANKAVPGSVIRKTLLAEKRNRVKFEAAMKNSLEDIKTSFNEFKRESVKLMANHSDTVERRLEQSSDFLNGSLNDLTEDLSDTNTRLSSIVEVTINNKIDGGWSRWENWGSCSESCGGGVQSRIRTCSNPRPSLPGRICDGSPLQTKICNKHQCKEFNVVFTAYYIKYYDSTSRSTIVFQSTHINNGNAYDTTTGKFTCKIPGVYYFSVTLTKRYMKISYAEAYLRINGVKKLAMYWYPYDNDDKHEYDSTPLTHSGTFHLNKNDVVDIDGIPKYFAYSYYSTFTGYLITPD